MSGHRQWASTSIRLSKAKRHYAYLFTCKVSKYCLSAWHGSSGIASEKLIKMHAHILVAHNNSKSNNLYFWLYFRLYFFKNLSNNKNDLTKVCMHCVADGNVGENLNCNSLSLLYAIQSLLHVSDFNYSPTQNYSRPIVENIEKTLRKERYIYEDAVF